MRIDIAFWVFIIRVVRYAKNLLKRIAIVITVPPLVLLGVITWVILGVNLIPLRQNVRGGDKVISLDECLDKDTKKDP